MIRAELYRTDGDQPAFFTSATDVVKFGLDNPDGSLLRAPIRDDHTYRIYGRATSIHMVEFLVPSREGPMVRYLDEFERDADGRFMITLAAEPHAGSWIPAGATSLHVRRVTYDWDTEVIPHIAIARVGADPGAVPWCLRTPSPAEVGEQLDALVELITQHSDYWIDMVHSFRDEGDNVIPTLRPLPETGTNEVRASAKGVFSLAPDETLVVTFEPPEGRFWSICLGDIWYRTFNAANHQTSLNGHQALLTKATALQPQRPSCFRDIRRVGTPGRGVGPTWAW